MAFANSISRRFNRPSVERDAPAMPGVYGLSNAREWVYIGYAADLRAELLSLVQAAGSNSTGAPTGYSFEICSPAEIEGRCRHLISELKPARARL